MDEQIKLEEALSKFTREYIKIFNRLENNISYSIRYMFEIDKPTLTIGNIQSLSFCKKIKNLKEIIAAKNLTEEFSDWLEKLECYRVLRNNLVHGSWEVLWHLDKPIRVDARKIKGSDSDPVTGEYTAKDLSNKLNELECAENGFSTLRKKYEKLKMTKHPE